MLVKNYRPQSGMTIRISIYCGLAFALAIFLFPSSASARSLPVLRSAADPTFRVIAGFDARYRDGNWIPIQVALRNDGPDFTGSVSVAVPIPYAGAGNASSLSTYQQTISLPSGSQKQVTLYVPFYLGSQGFTQNLIVDLLDATGRKVNSQPAALHALGPGDVFIGILSDQPTTGFTPLNALPLPNPSASVITQPLNAATFPTIADALNNFDLIVLDNFTTSSLSKDQLATLQNWVHQGGNLIIVGGPEWRKTLSSLPTSLLPVAITGTDTVPAGTRMLPFVGPQSGTAKKAFDTISAPVAISTATPANGSTVSLANGTTPLIVQSQLGQGQICYLAFDPTLDPIVNWPQAITLWKSLLLRSLGDKLLVTSPSATITTPGKIPTTSGTSLGGVLQSLFPTTFIATWLILILLLGYILVLGPVRLLAVQRLKNRDWSWRIVLSTITIFSLLSYGLALQQKGTSILSSSISVVQLDRPGTTASMAHTTTYVGIFVPNQGDFRVHMPGFSQVQPSNDQSRVQGSLVSQPTTITTTQNGMDVTLQGVNIWTLRTLMSKRDQPVRGGILSRLTLQDKTLSGTVTNTLPYPLSDAYVLIYNHFLSLGHMATGQTKQVSLLLQDNANGQPLSLADQIASSKHVSIPYGTAGNGSPQLSEVQRRSAMLAALSGEMAYPDCGSGFCTQSSGVLTSNGFYGSNGTYNFNTYSLIQNGGDPLAVPNAPATLIGWADRPADTTSNVTINDSYTSKAQEALVQAPLDVSFSGRVNLPPVAVLSQLVDVQGQGNNIQTLFPGVYALTSGSMTFEFTLPTIAHPQAGSLLISTSSSLPQQLGNTSNQGSVDANHLRPYLYNWQKRTWDSYTFNTFTFSTTTPQSYIGPGGRVLLRLANLDSAQGTAIFGKPSLELQSASSSSR